jgi:serine/threonine protein kinase
MYIRSLPHMETIPWRHLFPNESPAALDLLQNLLQFDPELRFTVEQTLAHPYLESYHDIEDEVCFISISRIVLHPSSLLTQICLTFLLNLLKVSKI